MQRIGVHGQRLTRICTICECGDSASCKQLTDRGSDLTVPTAHAWCISSRCTRGSIIKLRNNFCSKLLSYSVELIIPLLLLRIVSSGRVRSTPQPLTAATNGLGSKGVG